MSDSTGPFALVAAGSSGIDEMRKHVDESKVQFGLLKFVFGSGAFARKKMLFVHLNGEQCPGLRRGRVNTKKGAAKELVGAVAAELVMSTAEECSVDHVLDHLSTIIASDRMSGGMSVAAMKADYERMLAAARSTCRSLSPRKRRTAAEMGTVPSVRALEEIRKPLGAFNWCLFKPTESTGAIEFSNAGSGSIDELREWLKPTEVSFALLRMGFGTGRFRRTKYIFVHWSGEAVCAIKRGKANSHRKEAAEMLSPWSIDMSVTSLDEIEIGEVIDKVRRATRVDGGDEETKDADPLSVDAFMDALREEQAANAAFFGDDEVDLCEGMSLPTALKTIHDHDGFVNWLMFEVKETGARLTGFSSSESTA